jgi:para-aminobenzoate synthetase/4-amino-4-deoxychorismate lyase
MMIVDMIRNDMGRIAEIGTVEVPALFDVERYPTLFQMTSTVRCRTDVPLSAIFAAMFPCASITGAPKVKSMELIKGLETAPRGVYCGSIGYAGPGRKAAFNVAIRTLTFDRLSKRAVYGVGGGVVWDSAEEMEYEECLLKAHVLEHDMPEFKLLESLLWEPAGGYFLLERHLQRLTESAAYFGFPLREDEVRACLAELGKGLDAPAKVRLLVDKGGTAALEAQALEPPGTAAAVPLRLAVCRTPVDSSDVFLYHKTTVRRLYEDAKASRPDCDDVIIMNERGEVTEASSSNIMVEVSGAFYTPPVECGLLPGTYRAELIAAGMLSERVLYPADLYRAESVALINSVRRKRNAAVLP